MRVSLLLAAAAATATPVTESDSTVEDLEGKIAALKQSEASLQKYVPQDYQEAALRRTKSELAALEAKLKAAKLEAKGKAEDEEKKDEGKKGENGQAVTDLLAETASG